MAGGHQRTWHRMLVDEISLTKYMYFKADCFLIDQTIYEVAFVFKQPSVTSRIQRLSELVML